MNYGLTIHDLPDAAILAKREQAAAKAADADVECGMCKDWERLDALAQEWSRYNAQVLMYDGEIARRQRLS